ncbi:hypothetical protein LZ30DRAFT_714609 [Colletotrichum cereale]|nr:hypothetical protein LZ30DRAFT_714609 [Colletotrichum cereale]
MEEKELFSANTSDLWQSFEIGYAKPIALDYSSSDSGAELGSLSADLHHRSYRQATETYSIKQTVPSIQTVPSKQTEYPRPKRIIICCDGTWQSSVNGRRDIPSNVTRLARSIALTGTMKKNKRSEEYTQEDGNEYGEREDQEEDDDITCPQVVFYSSGVGTGGGVSILENARQALFGDGLVAEVIKAYNFVVMNYSPGDEILCFGFSRGAYTARSVAGLITDIGVIQPREMDDFPDLYHIYQKHGSESGSNFRQSKAYREWITGVFDEDKLVRKSHRLPPESSRVVEVVGVFDTVGALGIPGFHGVQKVLNFIADYFPYSGIDYQGFHNTSLSNYTKHAFHALALDEHIKPFTPTLWHLPEEGEDSDDEEAYEDEQPFESETSLRKKRAKDKKRAEANFNHLIKRAPEATETQLSAAWKKVINTHAAAEPKDFTPRLQQVWFPGGHVNIGGGNSTLLINFPYDFEQLSLISFAWMCDQVTPLIRLDDKPMEGKPDSSELAQREMEARKELILRIKRERESGLLCHLRRLLRRVFPVDYAAPTYKEDDQSDDLWATGSMVDIFDILGGFLILGLVVFFLKLVPFMSSYRTPGQYKDANQKGRGITNEMIHPSVYYRHINVLEYSPKSLMGFSRSKRSNAKGDQLSPKYEWRSKEVVLPEYQIKEEDHISRHMIEHSKAREFMAPLMGR